MTPKLVAIAGLLKGQDFPLGSSLRIGRDPSNGLAIADPLLSQRHCTIERDEDGFRIKDAGSLNGTFVNGTRVEESRLESGDRIKAGDTHFILLAHDDDAGAKIEIEELDLTGQDKDPGSVWTPPELPAPAHSEPGLEVRDQEKSVTTDPHAHSDS